MPFESLKQGLPLGELRDKVWSVLFCYYSGFSSRQQILRDGRYGYPQSFEIRAVTNKFSNLRIIMTGYSSRPIKKEIYRQLISKIKDLLTYST